MRYRVTDYDGKVLEPGSSTYSIDNDDKKFTANRELLIIDFGTVDGWTYHIDYTGCILYAGRNSRLRNRYSYHMILNLGSGSFVKIPTNKTVLYNSNDGVTDINLETDNDMILHSQHESTLVKQYCKMCLSGKIKRLTYRDVALDGIAIPCMIIFRAILLLLCGLGIVISSVLETVLYPLLILIGFCINKNITWFITAYLHSYIGSYAS